LTEQANSGKGHIRDFAGVLLGLALFSFLLTACEAAGSVNGDLDRNRTELDAEFLLGDAPLAAPVSTAAYKPPDNAAPVARFEGRLELRIPEEAGQIEGLIDWFGQLENPELELARLPPFSFRFVQDENNLLPVVRGVQKTSHPNWEWILQPGKTWSEAGDSGFTRASVPFALQERNANCTHNGLMTFLFKANGEVSRVAYQVGSETCQYLQLNLWGVLEAEYVPENIAGAAQVIDGYKREVSARLPIRPIEALAQDYPGVDVGQFKLHEPSEVSVFGFVAGGIHYAGECPTRFGPYPYCEVLALPSYSLAKSVLAGSALMWLEQRYPGAGELLVSDYVPECRQDQRWVDVTLEQLVDMSSGNFESPEGQTDEFHSYTTDFISADSHALKIKSSCDMFPRKDLPGRTFVYHSSDTYIAGALMNAFLREQSSSGRGHENDIHADILVEEILKPLGLSPLSWVSKRSYDEVAQPFTGFGLTFNSDDIVRFGRFLMNDGGMINGRQILDRSTLQAALQRNEADTGAAMNSGIVRYNNGLWAYDVQQFTDCTAPTWVPYMSGYGGISVALIPNDTVYYVFSDGGNFKWGKAAAESNKIENYCN
jgi:hypothetical protein